MESLLSVGLLQFPIALGLVASAIFYVIEIWSARQFFRPRPVVHPLFQPPVTILKPLKGVDVELYENLATFCRQIYPEFEIICGVAAADDPAIEVVRRLQRDFPHVALSLVIDGRVYGTNYKVSNLHNMYRHARHDVIVLADSDIRVGPEYLTRVVEPLRDRRVGVSTCLYRAVNTGGLPTLIESLFINTDFANLVMLARKVEKASYAFGATIAMRREVLDEIGGFLPIANLLADDYEIGYRAFQRGYVNELSTEVVDTVLSVGSWRRLYDHQVRWARTYRVNRPGGYFGSILTHGTFWALLNVLLNGFSPLSCLASGGLLALRYTAAARMAWTHLKTDHGLAALALVAPKDLFVTAVWFAAFAGNTVVWSGHRFEVGSGGEMEDLTSSPAMAAPDEAEPHRQRA
ncbi:bacteriohopanetetrol glucosamine biosynthesis glycosyltransferase HpnI [bacterium]|nr:bacteriohopanetetrol glucosamine biosynthesis glycosyltransferase HpnI [bacterium]